MNRQEALKPSRSLEEAAKKLGISPEKLKELEDKARAEVYADDTWEKELDARNKAKAGIFVENDGRDIKK